MNPLTALALRRITGEGSSVSSSNGSSPTSPTSFFTNNSFQHAPAIEHDRLPSWAGALDGSTNGFFSSSQSGGSCPVFNMGALGTILPQPKAMKPHLSLLTDVGRKYPGFPTPLSPTSGAKELWPSPASDARSVVATPRALSPTVRSVSPMSIDGSEMCGPSRRCESHGYGHYASQIGLIDNVLSGQQMRSNSRTPSASSRVIIGLATPPTSPSRCISPRTAMLKKMAEKQSMRSFSPPQAIPSPGPSLEFHPSTRNINAYPASPPLSARSFSTTHSVSSPPPSMPIANGVESESTSPIDPSGTMLFYTSNRSVDSGLLGVHPLSEPQVAEYRFWRPCGRRICGFGCGGADVGEAAAAKRLFKEVEDVCVEYEAEERDDEEKSEGKKPSGGGYGLDGHNDESKSGEGEGSERQLQEGLGSSVWAGRRLVTDWGSFLRGCEREGVAPF